MAEWNKVDGMQLFFTTPSIYWGLQKILNSTLQCLVSKFASVYAKTLSSNAPASIVDVNLKASR